MQSPHFVRGAFARWSRPRSSTRASTSRMPTSRSSWRGGSASVSISSASGLSSALPPASALGCTSCSREGLQKLHGPRECERALLTDELLPLRIKDGQAIVGYLDDGDHTWVRALIDELERH